MRHQAAIVGVVALFPFAFISFPSSALAQACVGIDATGNVCSEDNMNPADAEQRRSDEATRQAREQYEAQTHQRDEEYNQAVAAERDRAESQARRRDEDTNQTLPVQRRSVPIGSAGDARQTMPRTAAPGPAQLSTNPSVAAYQRGDYPLAFSLTREQARKGDLNAWHNLGIFYEKGIGTRPDPTLALQWFRACADLRNAECQFELGRLTYFGGLGLARDPVEAYKWFLLAGRESANARRVMPAVQRRLSYEQLNEAMRRYEQWSPPANVRTPESAPSRSRH